jgi:hypothetical protein
MFKVASSNMFDLPGTGGRFVHLASITKSVREYMLFVDIDTNQCYIEEVTAGHLEFINDDSLALALAKFCEEKNLSDPRRVGEYLNGKAIKQRTERG